MDQVADRRHISYLQDTVQRRRVRQCPSCRQVRTKSPTVNTLNWTNSEQTSNLGFYLISLGLSPPTQAPWKQEPPNWGDPKQPQMIPAQPPPPHIPPPQPIHAPQMGGYAPQYWYQPETNPSLLSWVPNCREAVPSTNESNVSVSVISLPSSYDRFMTTYT